MKQLIKYFTTGNEDINWGVYLNSAGSLVIPANVVYPSRSHPSGYYFTWEQGRILPEYQLNYITEGGGVFENRYGEFPVKAGCLLVVFPGVWHRYKPDFSTGWRENYIGFSGQAVKSFMNHPLFSPGQPVIQTGIREELLDTYLKIYDLAEKESPGFQQVASGLVIKLLGYLVAYEKQKGFSGKRITEIIEKARFVMRSDVGKTPDMEEFAKVYNIGYSWFRRMFKKYTGLSPRQYCLQLKIMRAKELLLSTDLSVKEISYQLGFESIHYFSRLFKMKTGVTPINFRGQRYS